MYIAVNGCSHGELDRLYAAIADAERARGIKVDLLLCCGDFQAVRHPADLRAMSIPSKYYAMNTFWKYYKGDVTAPVLTIVIGGNHEASNHFAELPYGGWLAPNIYFLGYAGVVNFGGLRIGGISGIYKGFDFMKGRFEFPPYSQDTLRSTYHQRNFDVFRLKQLAKNAAEPGRGIDIFMSHDWPRGVPPGPPIPGADQGFAVESDVNGLLRRKKFLADDIQRNQLGSPALAALLKTLHPTHWFCGHLHVRFGATVKYPDGAETQLLAVDKPLPGRQFLEILELANRTGGNTTETPKLAHDLDWLAILASTDHLMELSRRQHYMPGSTSEGERYDFTPTDEEIEEIRSQFGSLEIAAGSFVRTAPPAESSSVHTREKPELYVNPQTQSLCRKLGIPDWFERTKKTGLSKPVFSPLLDASSSSADCTADAETAKVANPDEIALDDVSDDATADEAGNGAPLDKGDDKDVGFHIDRSADPADRFSPVADGVLPVHPAAEPMSFPSIKTPDDGGKKRTGDEDQPVQSNAVKKFKRRNASIYDSRDDEE